VKYFQETRFAFGQAGREMSANDIAKVIGNLFKIAQVWGGSQKSI
jgi:hypothetical protein